MKKRYNNYNNTQNKTIKSSSLHSGKSEALGSAYIGSIQEYQFHPRKIQHVTLNNWNAKQFDWLGQ